ncbi:MAG: lysophospholipid acyltransferase family protein [Saprospiraceae bacterium]
MNTLRASWRLFLFLGTLTWYGFPLWIRAAIGNIDWDHHQTVRQKFAKSALRKLGIQLTVEGTPHQGGACVYASNHRSWLDPFLQLATVWAFPVAKAEVGKLPIVAQGAKATGILFVDRGSKNSRKNVVDQMVGALKEGFSILIYPEGTTSTDAGTIAFKRGGFTVAQEAECPIVPMAVRYADPSFHWGDGESLWKNFVQIAGSKTTPVTLYIGKARNVGNAIETMKETRVEIDNWILGTS